MAMKTLANIAALTVGKAAPRGAFDGPVRAPFLKWAGAKTKLVPAILKLLPASAERYIEPFAGSAAVWLNTSYKSNVLADANADIISSFRLLQEHGRGFVEVCEELFTPENNRRERFYELRNEFNACSHAGVRSVLFVYLNRHCFNGLCRYNRDGKFNVPFGRYDRPHFPHDEMIAFAQKLAGVKLYAGDFRDVLPAAGEKDAVYCDPPYFPVNANFTDYASGGFGPKDQEELAALAFAAARRGAAVVVSNSDTAEVRRLYEHAAQVVPLMVRRSISCQANNRKAAAELLFRL
jgi:DNA adenine methylase